MLFGGGFVEEEGVGVGEEGLVRAETEDHEDL